MHRQAEQEEDPILTTTGAAGILEVAVSTVQVWMEEGRILSWKTPGGHRRTRTSTVLAMQAEMEGGPVSDHETAWRRSGLRDRCSTQVKAPAGCMTARSRFEARFDRVARLAATVTKSPIALVSDLTPERLWIKGCVGLDLLNARREWTFCAHTVEQTDPLIVEDASMDARFAGLPIVLAHPHVRFYAGIALRDHAGVAVGTLCVMDREARRLRKAELDALSDLAAVAAHEVTKRGS
ncbi:GAF domain-containing protein [Massilia sp. IC2-278]|uniref:GAF domain-containing protein n=1 Tax=Massilia sp. IC2-278 TaxID=2887200 RepID=UPI001E402FFA|nr:GAF domain-containing protein [Massilia sp. IC2-278]MCC2959580.1 GAF domain-containing protein [Massilia sp. IC2-278]